MAKNNTSTSAKKSSFLKILWWALTPILITLIFFGTYSMISKKKTVETISPSFSKPIPAKPKEEVWDWTFEWEATAEQLASGRQKTVGLINDAVLTATPTDKVLKFKYKRPSGKLVELTLSRSDVGKFYRG